MIRTDNRSAFIYRVRPGGIDRLDEALQTNQLITGWAKAEGLLDSSLTWGDFREVIRRVYYTDHESLRRAGAAAGHLWRFIREMKPGDLVVVPHGDKFYVAEVTGDAVYDSSKVSEDSAYRRPVRWRNDKKPIPRSLARAALQVRMKVHGTSARSSDLLNEIEEVLELAEKDEHPTFQSELHSRLVKDTLKEIRTGRINDRDFESLVASLLIRLGASNAKIVSRKEDKGADILAEFRVARIFSLLIAVQAKHWWGDAPVSAKVVEQLIRGIEAENANLGIIITSGRISDEAFKIAGQYLEDTGIQIEFIDGKELAKLIIEYGILLG